MTLIKLSEQDANDIVVGSKILACGGGGREKRAFENIKKIYDKGENFTLVDLSDLKDNDNICIIGMVGGGITEEDKKYVENSPIVVIKSLQLNG